jgi:nucleoside-diphosphate-sugar epimerase
MKSGSRVSITGATGFLGWHLAEAFRDRGWLVRALVRPGSTKPVPERVERVEAPLGATRPATDALIAACAGSGLIVHGAALVRAGSLEAFDQTNVHGTRAVVEAANSAGAPLLFISSQAAAGPGTPEHPTREDAEPRPLTPYGRSKLAAEAIVRSEARVPWTILRPSAIYGPRDRGFLPLFRLARRGWFLQLTRPHASFTFVHVHDVVRAVLLAAEQQEAERASLFVGHETPHRAEELLQYVADAVGRPYRARVVPAAVLGALALGGDLWWKLGGTPLVDTARFTELRAEGFVCSVACARERIGFVAAVPLGEGIARTARWYREHSWI